jgi:hypothetical protein
LECGSPLPLFPRCQAAKESVLITKMLATKAPEDINVEVDRVFALSPGERGKRNQRREILSRAAAKCLGESARGLAQSKTWRSCLGRSRSVLECFSFHCARSQMKNRKSKIKCSPWRITGSIGGNIFFENQEWFNVRLDAQGWIIFDLRSTIYERSAGSRRFVGSKVFKKPTRTRVCYPSF